MLSHCVSAGIGSRGRLGFPSPPLLSQTKHASSSFQKSSWKDERRVGSRRARHSAAGFAWTEVPVPPERRSLRATSAPSWSLGTGSSPIARTIHLRRKGSEERKSLPTRGTGTCHLVGLCLLVLTAEAKMSCLLPLAVLCVRSCVKCSGAICQFGFSSYC